MPSLKIEVIGNICCLIEEQQVRLQIGKACFAMKSLFGLAIVGTT
jgi:hypothetical protein